MPKETFTNLPEQKRNMILDTALDEFHRFGYEKASISRIVEKAGIAKGSFYQYFEGKEDLFKVLFITAGEKKVQYLSDLGAGSGEKSLFDLLQVLYLGALEFMKEHPKLSEVTDRFMKSGNETLKKEILGTSMQQSSRFIEDLLLHAADRQEIRSDIDIPFTAYFLTELSISLGDYLRGQAEDLSDIDDTAYRRLVEQVLDLLRRGVSS